MSPINEAIELSSSEEEGDKNHKKEKKGFSKLYITVEPIKIIVGFTTAFTSGVLIDLIQRNICHNQYGLSLQECTSLNVTEDIKVKVEGDTAQVNMVINLIQGFIPLFLILFIGPWSDKHGRKPFLLLSVKGYAVYYFLWTVIAFFPSISVVYMFIPPIVLSCTGNIMVIFISIQSYICDNFDEEELPVRFSVTSAAMCVGQLAGNGLAENFLILGGEYGFQVIFGISFIMSLVSIVYTSYVLEETIIIKKEKHGKLFNLSHLKSLYDAISNPVKGRLLLFLILTVIITEIPLYSGEDRIYYLAGKSLYNWSLGRYNAFAVLMALLQGVVSTLILWCLMDLLRISNSTVLVLSSMLLAIFHLFRVFSVNENMFWAMSSLIKSVNLIGPTIDAELTACISEENAGKVFTLSSLIDCLGPLVSTPLYAQVYTLVIPDKTLNLFFLSFGMALVSMLSSIWVHFHKKKALGNLPHNESSCDDQKEPDETSSLKA